MKAFSDAAMEAIERGEAVVSGAVSILCDPPIRVWGGYEPIELDADEWFDGVGDRGLAQMSGGALGGSAQGITLELSGIEPEVLALLDADEIKNAPVILWRLIFASNAKTMLDYHVFERGRVDQVLTVDVVGATATIKVAVESAGRGLGRNGGRMRSDADQRLINPADGYFRNASYAGEKMFYWGGPRPTVGSAAAGGGGGRGGREPYNTNVRPV